MVKINKTNASVDLRKMEYLFLLGMQTSETNMEISVEISKKKKNLEIIWCVLPWGILFLPFSALLN